MIEAIRRHLYLLVERHPVEYIGDVVGWAQWFEAMERRIARTRVGPYEVSTVFLGLNHQYSPDPAAPPLVFETMTFVGEIGDMTGIEPPEDLDAWGCARCSTWDEAERQHMQAVAAIVVHEIETTGRQPAVEAQFRNPLATAAVEVLS